MQFGYFVISVTRFACQKSQSIFSFMYYGAMPLINKDYVLLKNKAQMISYILIDSTMTKVTRLIMELVVHISYLSLIDEDLKNA